MRAAGESVLVWGGDAMLEALKASGHNGRAARTRSADAAAPVIWDSEAAGNACEGLKKKQTKKTAPAIKPGTH